MFLDCEVLVVEIALAEILKLGRFELTTTHGPLTGLPCHGFTGAGLSFALPVNLIPTHVMPHALDGGHEDSVERPQ